MKSAESNGSSFRLFYLQSSIRRFTRHSPLSYEPNVRVPLDSALTMPLIVADCEHADWIVQSFCSEQQELGRLACVSKHFLKHIFSENHDERLWSPLADEFIEWMPDSSPPAKDITRVFGGYRHLLKYRRASGPKMEWGSFLRMLDSNQTAAVYHPYLQYVQQTLFFTDY